MTDWKERIHDEVEDLRRIRDELRLKVHLGKAEVTDRWERLEENWNHLEGRLDVVRSESKESMNDIGEAAQLLVNEIRKGYRHIRELL